MMKEKQTAIVWLCFFPPALFWWPTMWIVPLIQHEGKSVRLNVWFLTL